MDTDQPGQGGMALPCHETNADHLVPLATQAVTILHELKALTGNGRPVFPGARDIKRPMSEAAIKCCASAAWLRYPHRDNRPRFPGDGAHDPA
jgi:integrase